jgi:hypothetical protein
MPGPAVAGAGAQRKSRVKPGQRPDQAGLAARVARLLRPGRTQEERCGHQLALSGRQPSGRGRLPPAESADFRRRRRPPPGPAPAGDAAPAGTTAGPSIGAAAKVEPDIPATVCLPRPTRPAAWPTAACHEAGASIRPSAVGTADRAITSISPRSAVRASVRAAASGAGRHPADHLSPACGVRRSGSPR